MHRRVTFLAGLFLLTGPACASARSVEPGYAPGGDLPHDDESVAAEPAPAMAEEAVMASSAPAAPAARSTMRAPRAAQSRARVVSMQARDTAGAPGGKARTAEVAVDPAAPAARSPILIYTAQLTLATFEVAPALKAAETLARELGGFMAQQTNANIVIRVPVERFHEALERIEKLGDVTGRNIQAEDVTQEFFDLEVRIKSARAVRERLEQLLSRASKVDESIAIERELERVVGEIERLEGRLKFLKDRALFSTINVSFAPRPKEVVAKDTFRLPFPWLDQLGLGRLLQLR